MFAGAYCGRIERGESQPTLYVILKVPAALGIEGYLLVQRIEQALAKGRRASKRKQS